MGHDHDHGVGLARAGERHRGRLAWAFGLTFGFFFVQAATGIIANSLALLSDAAHMLTDVIGLGMALAAIQLASRFAATGSAKRSSHTFGLYRLEILAAFVNALLLFGVAIWVLYEAAKRVFDEPEVLGVPMLIVATIGLAINVIAFLLLREGSKESLNVEGA
ncbi:MAG: cation diffusion facilitator family transporter, partial [Actinomycetota bacterium]